MVNAKINFVVGLVILVALFILMFGIHFLKNSVPGEKKDIYFAVFQEVSTLQKGDPVKLNGVSMGRVKDIELWKNKVRVRFDLKRSYKDHEGQTHKISIPVNSTLTIQNIGLMGERQIEIQLGDSPENYPPGTIIENGKFDAGIAEAMGTAGKVFEESEKLILDVKTIFDSTLGRDDFVETFNGVLADTKHLSGKLNGLVDYVDPKVRESIRNLEKLSEELNTLLASQEESIKGLIQNGENISVKADELMGKVSGLTDEVSGIVQKMNSTDGTLGAMLNDTEFYRDLRSTLQRADSLLFIIKKQGLDVNVDLF